MTAPTPSPAGHMALILSRKAGMVAKHRAIHEHIGTLAKEAEPPWKKGKSNA